MNPQALLFVLAGAVFVLADDPPRCRYFPGYVWLVGSMSSDSQHYIKIYGNSTVQAYNHTITSSRLLNNGRIERLPIWNILIPRNTIAASVSRISDQGKLSDPIQVDMKSTAEYPMFIYSKLVDVTKQAIVSNAWYLICISVRFYFGQNMQICQHCTISLASSMEINAIMRKKLVYLVPPSSQCGAKDGITLKYHVFDFLPLKQFKIVTKVLKGCQPGDPTDPKYETALNVEPNIVAFVDLDLRSLAGGEETYILVTTLIFTFDRIVEVDFYLNDQLRLQPYGRSSTGFWVLSKNSKGQWRLTFD